MRKGDFKTTTKVLKSSGREPDEIHGDNHFWCAISGEYLAEAVDNGTGCDRFKIYDL